MALKPFDEGPATAAATVSVRTSASGETTATMQASGLPVAARGTYYEVWAIAADGQMVSLGQLPVSADGHAAGEMAVPVSLAHFSTLDVSVQPKTAGPHVHSGHSVLRSATA